MTLLCLANDERICVDRKIEVDCVARMVLSQHSVCRCLNKYLNGCVLRVGASKGARQIEGRRKRKSY